MKALDLISSTDIGERLRIAREAVNLTQKEAADKLNIARTTLVAIEKGERRVRIRELQELAKIYGSTINSILRVESVNPDFTPRFRKLTNTNDSAIISAVQELNNLVKAEIELENLLGIKRRMSYPPERPILPGNIQIQAEQYAQELRLRLGLGTGPIPDIISLLELELDVRIYIRRLDSKISGLFAYDDKFGSCILLNANHPRERRAQSAAHECGHFISARSQPEILCIDEIESSREEMYADAFGRAFLAPVQGVMQRFYEVTSGSERLTRRHVIILSHMFGISREAMVRRLEELDLVKKGTWDWFQSNGGITNDQAKQALGDRYIIDNLFDTDRPTTIRLNSLAYEVYRKDLLSEGQLARLLHLDRIELRNILSEAESERDEDDAPKILF
jgi:Zn-dependent peptidase ImmA (M78 family)/DNA-binding XRE family transcriptional regulator